jgi:hypothetical protein
VVVVVMVMMIVMMMMMMVIPLYAFISHIFSNLQVFRLKPSFRKLI